MRVQLPEQVACVERELGYRKRVYARWVEAGRMTRQKMDHEIAAMTAVLETVRAAEAGTRLL